MFMENECEYLRETKGLDGEWEIYRGSVLEEECPKGYVKFTGAVAPYKKGTTERNWKRRDKSTESTHFVCTAEFDVWHDARCKAKNVCTECNGKGLVFASWSKTEGTRMRTCRVCQGTGIYQKKEQAK